MKFLLFLLLLATSAFADLGDYPYSFIEGDKFSGQIIVGSLAPATDVLGATDIALSLQSISSTPITANTEEYFQESIPAILIGLPCQNIAMAQILSTNSCDIGLNPGEGVIKLVGDNLIVSGSTPSDTRRAARYLASAKSLSGEEVRVGGTLDIPTYIEHETLEINTSEEDPNCVFHSDCEENQVCSSGACFDLDCRYGSKNHECIIIPLPVKENVSFPDDSAEEKAIIESSPMDALPEQELVVAEQGIWEKILALFNSFF